jgi:hypothetical protein
MKESQRHMAELDKHLYVVIRGLLLYFVRSMLMRLWFREEYAKSQGGEQN